VLNTFWYAEEMDGRRNVADYWNTAGKFLDWDTEFGQQHVPTCLLGWCKVGRHCAHVPKKSLTLSDFGNIGEESDRLF
jgi:hypothetical protein